MDRLDPARVLALFLAAAVAIVHGYQGLLLLQENAIQAAGHLGVALLFLPPLLWVGLLPRQAAGVLDERLGLDLGETQELIGALLHLAFAYVVFGLTILNTAYAGAQYLETGQHPVEGQVIGSAQIIQGLLLNLALFVIAAITWLYLVERKRGRATWEELGLAGKDLLPGIGWGALTTLVVLLGVAGLGYAMQAIGYTPQNPQADAIADALDPTTAVLVAVLAGLGEELYFRGFLLPRTNNLTQAALFGAIHATYLTPFQVILPFLLGLVFGWVRRATSLWAVIAAHTGFNAVMLLGAIYGEELATALPFTLPF